MEAISDDPGRFAPGSRMSDGAGKALVVERSRRHGRRLIVKFAGIDTRSAAEAARGSLFTEPEDLRELDPDEFWAQDLIGLTVVDASGQGLGTVADVVPGSAQDLLQLETPAGERLVPAVKDIVVEVDVPGRRVTVDPPAGLLD